MCPIRRSRLIRGGSHALEVVLNQHPVEKHGHARRALERAVGLEVRPVEDDVVRLPVAGRSRGVDERGILDRKSTRLNSSHSQISYAVFCLKKKKKHTWSKKRE